MPLRVRQLRRPLHELAPSCAWIGSNSPQRAVRVAGAADVRHDVDVAALHEVGELARPGLAGRAEPRVLAVGRLRHHAPGTAPAPGCRRLFAGVVDVRAQHGAVAHRTGTLCCSATPYFAGSGYQAAAAGAAKASVAGQP